MFYGADGVSWTVGKIFEAAGVGGEAAGMVFLAAATVQGLAKVALGRGGVDFQVAGVVFEPAAVAKDIA